MRIALVYDRVYPWLNGGGERTLWEIALELSNVGHEIHYFGTKLWEGPDSIVSEGIVLHGVCRPSEFYNGAGRRTLTQPLRFGLSLFRALWRERKTSFDLINCTVFPYFSVFAIWLFRLLSGQRVPWVLSWLEVWGRAYWSSYLGSRGKGLIGFVVEWLCASCCPNHLVISPLQASRLQSLLGVPATRIQVLPRGTHLSRLPAGSTKRRYRVIYAGRMASYKNLSTVLRAWPSVVAACPDASLRLIGSGPFLSELKKLVRELCVVSSVEILPPKAAWEEAMDEIASSELFVQPSIREGQSVTAIEAMGVGTVVLAALHAESAVSDFLRHGENGWLIEEWNNPEAWASALVRLLQDESLRQELAASAYRAAQVFDWKTEIIPRMERAFAQFASEGSTEIGERVLATRSV